MFFTGMKYFILGLAPIQSRDGNQIKFDLPGGVSY